MRIEAFSESREPSHPAANEDAFVIIPGRAYAAIDGVTDRNGTRYDGMLAGRYAARLIAAKLEAMFTTAAPAAEDVVPALTATLAAAYRRHGVDPSAAGWGGRMCCTLALAIIRADVVEVVLVGDSGVRIGGHTVLQMAKDLDRITATLRRHAWPVIAARVADPVERERLARLFVFHGAKHGLPELFTHAEVAAITAAAEADCRTTLPHVPAADIAFLLREGIVDGQGAFQNNTDSVLGYACLDGFAVPRTLMRVARFDRADAAMLELFTDGYARPAPGFGVAAWEADFAVTEAEDPSKISAYPGVKGSVPGKWSDDRTYLGVVEG